MTPISQFETNLLPSNFSNILQLFCRKCNKTVGGIEILATVVWNKSRTGERDGYLINPFQANVPFLYPLKTSGFPMFSGGIETLASNGLKKHRNDVKNE